MGQKVNPISFRLGILYKASSTWFASKKDYQSLVLSDIKIKQFIFKRLALAGIVSVEIERSINIIKVIINAGRPGVIIGRGGSSLEILKKELEAYLKTIGATTSLKFQLEVKEVKNPDLSAKLIGERTRAAYQTLSSSPRYLTGSRTCHVSRSQRCQNPSFRPCWRSRNWP
jgi:small subunit ribosomal protein S3